MQYALMIYSDPGYADALPTNVQEAVTTEFRALAEDPRCVSSARLGSAATATCLRVLDGRTLMTDGPFADTKEVLAGYYVLEASDLDAAIEFAGRIPAVRLGGAVEVRPLVEIPLETGH